MKRKWKRGGRNGKMAQEGEGEKRRRKRERRWLRKRGEGKRSEKREETKGIRKGGGLGERGMKRRAKGREDDEKRKGVRKER